MLSLDAIMTTDVVTVRPTTPIYEALNLLSKHRISGMPVIDDDRRVVGVLSEKDVLRILIDKKLNITSTVDGYMSRDPICFTEKEEVMKVCAFFIRSHFRRVPVVRDGKLVGIISRADIIPVILEATNKISDFRYV